MIFLDDYSKTPGCKHCGQQRVDEPCIELFGAQTEIGNVAFWEFYGPI